MYKKDRNFGERRSFAPVQVGQELDVKIEAVGEKGDGIAKIKGFVIFVPNVKAGDEVRIKINKVLKKVGFGEVVGASSGTNESEDTEQEYAEDSEDTEQESKDSEDSGESEDMDYSNQEDSENFGEDQDS